MSDLEEELAAHLAGKASPFLFVGAGMSRRYINLDSWTELLRRFAETTGKPYGQYASDAAQDPARIASEIAEDFNAIWWHDDEYAERKERYGDTLHDRESPLKVEVAHLMSQSLDQLDVSSLYAEELKTIRAATIDGVITTNYDPLLEHLFPEFKTYVGQEELLFSEVQGVGEIYKIHGSCEQPDSLVLTAADYEAFDDKNPYLAAKLLTIFVDHPVIFLGYGLGDPNIQRILNAISRALSTENLNKLADRLVYVSWKQGALEPHLGSGTFQTEGGPITMRTVEVSDYTPIYRALGRVERKLPARLLRQLKERVYDLVLTSDPVGSLKVVNIEDAVSDMDVVFGVGAIQQLGSLGYFGVDRINIMDDILRDDGDFRADVLVKDVIPKLLKNAPFTPLMKYLRETGLLTKTGKLNSAKDLDSRIVAYVQGGAKRFGSTAPTYQKADPVIARKAGSFKGLVESEGDPRKVLRILHSFRHDALDLGDFREYLLEHRDEFVDAGGSDRSLFAKAVCLYDWLKYATA